MDSLWQDLSVCTKKFDLVTLTLNFHLLFKKLNLGYSFWTKRDKAFILHMWVLYDKTFLFVLKILILWPWPWLLIYFSKNLTLAITFEPKEIGLSYYRHVSLVARPFCVYQKFWPGTLTLTLTYFWKNLTLAITFEPKQIEHSYYMCVFLVARPLRRYKKISTYDTDFNFWSNFEKLKMLYHNYVITGL